MSNIVPFNFEQHAVRLVVIDGREWFVARDVALALGYVDPTNAIKQHCRGVVKHHPIIDALGRNQEARVIPESGLYRLIAGSTLPAAQRFEAWIFDDVLPSIRRTGGYSLPAAPVIPQTLPDALRLAADLAEGKERAESALALAAPKAAALDIIADSEGSFTITDSAKTLQVRPKFLFSWLRNNGWIYRRGDDLHGYQDKVQAGLLTHKVTLLPRADTSDKVVEQVRVTPKGLTRLAMEVVA